MNIPASRTVRCPTLLFASGTDADSGVMENDPRQLQRHFAFGENWQSFTKTVNAESIAEARRGLISLFLSSEIRGRRFLDAGCGSGLSMLACLTSAEVRQLDRLLDKLGKAVPGWANALTKRGVRVRKTAPKGVKGRPIQNGFA